MDQQGDTKECLQYSTLVDLASLKNKSGSINNSSHHLVKSNQPLSICINMSSNCYPSSSQSLDTLPESKSLPQRKGMNLPKPNFQSRCSKLQYVSRTTATWNIILNQPDASPICKRPPLARMPAAARAALALERARGQLRSSGVVWVLRWISSN